MPQQIVMSYGISKVRYDNAHSHIESVIVHKVGDQGILCEGCEWRRVDVVRRLIKGDSFVTLPMRKEGGVRFGQKVRIWDKKFIRSIPNGSASDNLAHLPGILGMYGISRKRYDSAHTHIERVKVHKIDRSLDPQIHDPRTRRDEMTICCDGCEWRCDDVVERIDEGDSFVTLRKMDDPPVKVVRPRPGPQDDRPRKPFLRSGANRRESDNLKELPDF